MRPPPVRPREAVLPFPELEWPQFEEAVRDLLRRRGFLNVERYGGQGDPQEGIDVRADDPDGVHTGIQAKREAEFGAAAVAAAVAATTYQASRFMIALSRRATVGALKEIDKHPAWQLWDQTRLSDEVRALPLADGVDFIERHFHEGHVQEFLGRGRPTAFLTRDLFFSPAGDRERLLTHVWRRVGGPRVLDELDSFLREERHRVALLTGPIGIGKSKGMTYLAQNRAGGGNKKGASFTTGGRQGCWLD